MLGRVYEYIVRKDCQTLCSVDKPSQQQNHEKHIVGASASCRLPPNAFSFSGGTCPSLEFVMRKRSSVLICMWVTELVLPLRWLQNTKTWQPESSVLRGYEMKAPKNAKTNKVVKPSVIIEPHRWSKCLSTKQEILHMKGVDRSLRSHRIFPKKMLETINLLESADTWAYAPRCFKFKKILEQPGGASPNSEMPPPFKILRGELEAPEVLKM